jgi:hypothetical protein
VGEETDSDQSSNLVALCFTVFTENAIYDARYKSEKEQYNG